MDSIHIPVLADEAMILLNPQPQERYIDATMNGGGHAIKIIQRIGDNGIYLGIDWDREIVEETRKKFKGLPNIHMRCGNYSKIKEIAESIGIKCANGIIFDLGYSTFHLAKSGRGFSFMTNEPLDMRYSPEENGLTAAQIANNWSKEDITEILRVYGQERFARRIAENIVKSRQKKKFENTFDLVTAVKMGIPKSVKTKINLATRTFQAFRIAVNKELENLSVGLLAAESMLCPSGKIAVISFHSGEDRIVKQFFKTEEKKGNLKILTQKPIRPTKKEISNNHKARSAILRAAEKIK